MFFFFLHISFKWVIGKQERKQCCHGVLCTSVNVQFYPVYNNFVQSLNIVFRVNKCFKKKASSKNICQYIGRFIKQMYRKKR